LSGVAGISVTGGVTVPLDKTEDEHRIAAPVQVQLARGSEAFTRVDPRAEARNRRASEPDVADRRYDLHDVIGRGGMGEVVAAHDVQIGREVAIKRLHSDSPSAGQLARFLREARIQGRLEHPAIPPVHELAHDDEGRPYFAMRKLEGVTLAETLRDPNSSFTKQRLLRAFVEICHAIDLAHSRRIVHRDIKPANILLGPRGEVFVLDWGIARELDASDAFAGTILGTPRYMAPEQARGDVDIDERVDIYALGCVLFEILQHKEINEPPLELASACERAMQPDRALRFATVSELGDVVQRYLDGDRDLEQRRALARHHLTSARDAFLRRDDSERRTIVMREAGKALALDPTLDGAAELIGSIMLEPPEDKLPPAVEQELGDLDRRGALLMSRVAISASVLFMLMLPTFVLLGVRDVFYATAYGLVSFTMLVIALANRQRVKRSLIILHTATMAVMFALLSRMFSPVLISPVLAVATLVVASFNPLSTGRRWSICMTIGMFLSVMGVWIAEWIGILPSSVIRMPNGILLTTPVDGGASFPAEVLSLIFVFVFGIAGTVGYFAMREIRQAREKLVLQAWHLRQLVRGP
jgi:eukaryotic-like serine/threonine-protein kinase